MRQTSDYYITIMKKEISLYVQRRGMEDPLNFSAYDIPLDTETFYLIFIFFNTKLNSATNKITSFCLFFSFLIAVSLLVRYNLRLFIIYVDKRDRS